jgi:hypothetical protein
MSLIIFCYREERSEYRGCGEYSQVHGSSFSWEVCENEEKAADWLFNEIWPHDDSDYRIVVIEQKAKYQFGWANSYSPSSWSQAFETGHLDQDDGTFDEDEEYEDVESRLDGIASTIRDLVREKLDARKGEEAKKKAAEEQVRRRQLHEQELARKRAEFERLKKELGD